MTRLIAPNGAAVNVSAEKAKRLAGEGYKPASQDKATTKRSGSTKSED
ncbi:hypothetical protein [Nocardioides ochotonae]|nr:hypothetical protein [Nocardioides ochotonae]